jgi:multimeric flavodoxin WrbA
MKILGLIGSYRKFGNTEVLVKEALMEAQRLGAHVSSLRLTDLSINPCKGCMACTFKSEECLIEDDWRTFRNALFESDGIILGAPTYLLGPAGIIKMITDRNISLQSGSLKHAPKPGAIIGISGVEGWEQFALPMLSVFMHTCGVQVLDQVMFYAQGPGEILLDDLAMERTRKVGSNIFEAVREPAEGRTYLGDRGLCPVCHQNLFSFKNGVLECAVCRVRAKVQGVDGKIELVFDSETLENHRWTEDAMFEHFSAAILPSGPRYLKNKNEIRKRAGKYQVLDSSPKKT